MSESTDVSATQKIEQVGGDHYKSTGLQHWDLCTSNDVPYLLGCASKYPARHRQKKGREDLEKAISYLERYGRARSNGEARYDPHRIVPAEQLIEWAAAAEIDARDLPILHAILCACQYQVAIERLREMIELEYAHPEQTRPGTPEDGGHHEKQHPEVTTLPNSITQFWYNHRLHPSEQVHYAYNPNSCRWDLQEGPYVRGYDMPELECGDYETEGKE